MSDVELSAVERKIVSDSLELSAVERKIVIDSLRYTARRYLLASRSHALTGPSYKDMRAIYRQSARDSSTLASRIEKTQ